MTPNSPIDPERSGPETIPVAIPVAPGEQALPEAIPVALPVDGDVPVAVPVGPEEQAPEAKEEAPAPPAPEQPVAEVAPRSLTCPVCGAPHTGQDPSCADCGYYFSPADLAGADDSGAERKPAPTGAPPGPADPPARVRDRYELGERIGERQGVTRFRALDHGDGSGPAVPVVVVRQEVPPAATPVEAPPAEERPGEETGDEILPTFDDFSAGAGPGTDVLPRLPDWPSLAWERNLLESLQDPALPAVRDSFTEGGHEYLVEEAPTGKPLWDAWDDPDAPPGERFGHLAELAELLHRLHQARAMLEGLRPDIVVVTDEGRVRLTDLSDLLPLPLPAGTPVRGTLYTAPELLSGQGQADARAALYSFGATLYALYVGRELTELDFDSPGHPKPFVPRFPDVHPAFGRLMMKTFTPEASARFPTDESAREDPTGFTELARTLRTLRRTFDSVRLEIASWTTTGMVRTGNEDAFALLHACESRQDDLGECALVLLCDGMGGYEAGEVAAAIALGVMRQHLVKQKPFAPLAGASPFPGDPQGEAPGPEGHAPAPTDVEEVKQHLKAAVREANRAVFAASRAPGSKRRGMGCTAEAVYVDGRHVVVGHVGDSRTYHLHEGRVVQLTRDQTLVNRLVELGTLSPEEAEAHPRRNELQQAVGGQPDVEPGLYHGTLRPGDWVVVCSDGLSNHVGAKDLEEMLLREATSAQMAARRLINLANIEGAHDNATVVVVRAT